MNDIIKKAIYFATEAHSGQFRKGGKTPYIAHPVHVAFLVYSYTKEVNTICAALLHDTVEDCEGVSFKIIEKHFGKEIASMVQDVTFIKKPTQHANITWREKKSLYLNQIRTVKAESLTVVACDKMTNMESYFTAVQTMPGVAEKAFKGTYGDYLWYYSEIGKILADTLGVHSAISRDYNSQLTNHKKMAAIA